MDVDQPTSYNSCNVQCAECYINPDDNNDAADISTEMSCSAGTLTSFTISWYGRGEVKGS